LLLAIAEKGRKLIPVRLELKSTPHWIIVEYLDLNPAVPFRWRLPSSCSRTPSIARRDERPPDFRPAYTLNIEINEFDHSSDRVRPTHIMQITHDRRNLLISITSNRTSGTLIMDMENAFHYTKYKLANGKETCVLRFADFELKKTITEDMRPFDFLANLHAYRFHGYEATKEGVLEVYVIRYQLANGAYAQKEVYLKPLGALADRNARFAPVLVRTLFESFTDVSCNHLSDSPSINSWTNSCRFTLFFRTETEVNQIGTSANDNFCEVCFLPRLGLSASQLQSERLRARATHATSEYLQRLLW
jgi:hypothetical protein